MAFERDGLRCHGHPPLGDGAVTPDLNTVDIAAPTASQTGRFGFLHGTLPASIPPWRIQ